MDKSAPDVPIGEPILPPLPRSAHLPEAIFITAGEVADVPPQGPSAEEVGAAGTSDLGAAHTEEGDLLVTPYGWQHAIPTDLIDDPMLSKEKLKQL